MGLMLCRSCFPLTATHLWVVHTIHPLLSPNRRLLRDMSVLFLYRLCFLSSFAIAVTATCTADLTSRRRSLMDIVYVAGKRKQNRVLVRTSLHGESVMIPKTDLFHDRHPLSRSEHSLSVISQKLGARILLTSSYQCFPNDCIAAGDLVLTIVVGFGWKYPERYYQSLALDVFLMKISFAFPAWTTQSLRGKITFYFHGRVYMPLEWSLASSTSHQ